MIAIDADTCRQFRHSLKSRYGEDVALLVDHPFRHLGWVITCELEDARGFYRCVCDNGYEGVFHESELTTNHNR